MSFNAERFPEKKASLFIALNIQSFLITPALIGAGIIIVKIAADRLITITTGVFSIFLAVTMALTEIATGYTFGIRFLSKRVSPLYPKRIVAAVLISALAICFGYCGMLS